MMFDRQTAFDLQEYLTSRRALVETRLAGYLAGDDPPPLWEAMRYSVLSGGKRLRALLCLAAAEAVGGQAAVELALPCACAIELVHAFSLIHDDLPAMDNDDFRRGRPTSHKVFGEAMAILAGDALFALAMEIVTARMPQQIAPPVALSLAGELARATGCLGMVGGQVADMSLTGRKDSQPEPVAERALELMHRRKTGALIGYSTWSGARLAGAGAEQLFAMSRFGEIIGLAFQIADDLLDVVGDLSLLGKTPGKDEAAGKVTWATVFGVDRSRARLAELEAEGRELLSRSIVEPRSLVILRSLLEYSIHRSS